MDKVLGKYLDDGRNDFPLDCETFDYIQNNNFITEVIGNIAGDKTFIYGFKKSGSTYSPGYAFLRTPQHPEGEILPFDGKGVVNNDNKIYIKTDDITVNTNEKTYSAYTKRSLSLSPTSYDSTGYNLNKFTYASYNKPMYGEIKIWSGSPDEIPPGYLLCIGTELKQSEYPNLYNVIGNMYNKQHIGSHNTYREDDYYTTRDGHFRIPDLSGRFIVSCGSDEQIPGDSINVNGYAFGSQGGLTTCTLTPEQTAVPNHNHDTTVTCMYDGTHRHWYAADDEAENITNYDLINYKDLGKGADGKGAGGVQQTTNSGYHNHVVSVTVNYAQGRNATSAHENKPPFMVLAYIIRVC